jgi:prepilin-type processing-associated H-X9-DG protein
MTYPIGASDTSKDSSGKTYASLPWSVYILPYIDQTPLFQRFDTTWSFTASAPASQPLSVTFNNPPNNVGNSTDPKINPAATPLKIYQCPSSPSQGRCYTDTWSQNPTGPTDSVGPYVGVASWTVSVSDYITATGVLSPYISSYYPGLAVATKDGILNTDFRVDPNMVHVGTSNCWLVGECGGAPDIYVAGYKLFDRFPYSNNGNPNAPGGPTGPFVCNGNGWADELNGDHWLGGNSADGLLPGKNGPKNINAGNMAGTGGYYSFHPGQANFLYADGHVQSINDNLDPKVAIGSSMFDSPIFVGQP